MEFYAGIDLHSNNHYIGIKDEKGKVICEMKKKENNLNEILRRLEPFKSNIKGVVVESTFNWYWLGDGLKKAGYKVHLANPAGIQQYKGLKHSDDKSDALWLAEMLRLNILPEGYIYPEKDRGIRDLLRKRMLLVRHRTALLLSMKGMINNCTCIRMTRAGVKSIKDDEIKELLDDPYHAQSVLSLNAVVRSSTDQIKKIEKIVLKKIKLRKGFKKLLSVVGIGDILGLTIMLETGEIGRFPEVGDYSSYSRCVSSQRLSNEKKKGKGNRKNGNKYLAWSYVEAAHYMKRFSPKAESWYQKKASRKGPIVATKALANKIARACYYIMKNQVVYDQSKLFV